MTVPPQFKSYAKVAVNTPNPTGLTFSYEIPSHLEARVGQFVIVPFGRQLLQGIIVEAPLDTPGFDPDQVRPISGADETDFRLAVEQIDLAKWMANYYFTPLWSVLKLFFPASLLRSPVKFYLISSDSENVVHPNQIALSNDQQLILDQLEKERSVEERLFTDRMSRVMPRSRLSVALRALVKLKLINEHFELGLAAGKPRIENMFRLTAEAFQKDVEVVDFAKLSRTVDAKLLRLVLAEGSVNVEVIKGRGHNWKRAADKLLTQGILGIENQKISVRLSNAELNNYLESTAMTGLERESLQILKAAVELHSQSGLRTFTRDDIKRWGIEGKGIGRSLELLRTKGLVEKIQVLKERSPLEPYVISRTPAKTLVEQQQSAVDTIIKSLESDSGQQFLLHGVTGSGKTEVYIECIRHIKTLGKKALLMVPEIALTPQMIRRIAEQFPGEVGVMHSGLSRGEIFDEWHAIKRGDYLVVIGSRSSIFVPQKDIRLIILDESHDNSYKQSQQEPRYDARTVASQMNQLYGCTIVYGSATPDPENYHLSNLGEIFKISMDEQVSVVAQSDGSRIPWARRPLSDIELVDMRRETGLISRRLSELIIEALDRNEQILLLVNRRGFAPFLICDDGCTPKCKRCDLVLSLHSDREPTQLVCHFCGASQIYDGICNTTNCERRLHPIGAGTQRVEDLINKQFPNARVARWDSDAVNGAKKHLELVERLERQEIDILVGTQMISKGLDLPFLTLVGVVSLEGLSGGQDFRSNQRIFSLLTQVKGRAGRANLPGKMIVQGYDLDNELVKAFINDEPQAYMDQEISWRRTYGYPPFRRIARLGIRHSNRLYIEQESVRLASSISSVAVSFPDSDVRGPFIPTISKAKGMFRREILIFSPDPNLILNKFGPLPAGWVVDIDPIDFY